MSKADSVQATLVLGAGAPHATLVAGALASVYEAGKTFTSIFTSGAGGLLGLLFAAPKDKEAPEALESLLHAGVADSIYSVFPLGYKTFFKRGPFTDLIYKWGSQFMLPGPLTGDDNKAKRFYNDVLSFAFTAFTPTTANFFSDGLCGHAPWIREAIDFEKLKAFRGNFYLNAYNIGTASTDMFGKEDLTAEHFFAALAFPFIYSPGRIGDTFYYEGATVDPLNLKHNFHCLLGPAAAKAAAAAAAAAEERPRRRPPSDKPEVDRQLTILMDVLGSHRKAIVRTPRNIIDAYGISIIAPIVSLSESRFENYRHSYLKPKSGESDKYVYRDEPDHEFYKMPFEIPESDWPYLLDWSYGNVSRLWALGRKAGAALIEEYGDRLPDRVKSGPNLANAE
jgi:NTE family protein